MKKKTRVLIISYTAALVAALAVGLIACRTDANRRQTAMDANYRHAYGEVLNAVQELDSSLQKSLYATTAAMECTVCTDIYSNAQTAEMALGVLPVNSHALERIARNIALAGDYARTLSRNAAEGRTFTSEELEHLRAFSDATKQLSTQLAALGRNTREKIDRLAPAAKIAVAGIHHIGGHIKGIAPFCCLAQLGSNTPQFGLVPNLVAGGAAFHYCLQSLDHITSVIGVPSRAASDKTAKVAGHNHIGVCATHAARKFSTRFGLGTDAARPHDAVAAGGAKLAKTAMRRLLIQSVPGCFYAICSGLCQHTFGIIPYGHVVDVALLAFHSCPTKLEVTRRAKSAPPSLSYWYHSQARASVRCATMEQ